MRRHPSFHSFGRHQDHDPAGFSSRGRSLLKGYIEYFFVLALFSITGESILYFIAKIA